MKNLLLAQVQNTLQAFADFRYYLALILGFIAWQLPHSANVISVHKLVFVALYEELIFRFLLQEFLRRSLGSRRIIGPLTWANIIASLAFCLVHLVHQPPLWALSVFLPSLVFGWAWDRYKALIPCAFLHFLYNFLFFYRIPF